MNIGELFAKKIDREIKGVIKVGQEDEGNIRQELEEYVVTRELQKHFRDFFSAYMRGITGTTDKMGVWISGFFGSGKSHFLKILSYLLANKEVDGKRAIDYFKDEHKIQDQMVLSDMMRAASVPTDVISFNIDSKSEMSGKQSKDAIVSVFLRVFNEMLGFSGAIPYLADLERRLTDEGRYEEFKEQFEEATGTEWTEARNDFDFIQDDIVDVLSDMDFMSVDAARNWCEKATGTYNISIEDFAKMVRKYIDRKGNNHHVVFLVDEIGQYIGDDTALMLNLQTVTEDLGRFCHGKVWVIVTSQQDIDAIAKTTARTNNDFSKIQGRFDTRLSLSSANVDEVIRKRLLEKTPSGQQTLALLYDDKETTIKNIIQFNDGVEKKLYSDRNNFASVYPFVTYQFNLMGSVLNAIRTYSSSGKHMSEGERPMLAVFQEAAKSVMDDEPGTLVPLYRFYDSLERYLDHSHSSVIIKAMDNEYLNPNHADDCFDVNVLKTLFMIKYVKEIEANIEQITSLMISSVDDNRFALQEQVEEALKRLIRQTLVQKNGNIHVFLTNEEQEVNREIERQGQNIEQSEIASKVSELIFEDLYDEKKYKYSKFNGRYQFAFNQVLDGRPYRPNQSHELTLKILTPYSDEIADEATYRLISGQSHCVLVVLPDDRTFLEELRTAISIEKFLTKDAANSITKFEQIKQAKKSEMIDRKRDAKLYLEEALKAAAIFVNGDKVTSTSRDIKTRINEAMSKLVAQVYHKLPYITFAASDTDIRAALRSGSQQISLDSDTTEKNKLALNDASDYISLNTARHMKTSMKSLLDRFMKPPYGFIEADVQWIVAKLFKSGEIAFIMNSEPITLLSKSEDEVFRFITRKEFNERLMLDRREKASDKQKKSVCDVMKGLFGTTSTSDDDDALMRLFTTYAESFKNKLDQLEIHYQSQPRYPGRAVIQSGRTLIQKVLGIKFTPEFYATVDSHRDEFLDLAEDFEPINTFFTGEQRKIFDKSLNLMRIYDDSKNFVVDDALEAIVAQIKQILNSKSPYNEIYKLPELNNQFNDRYSSILDTFMAPILEAIEAARKRVFEELDAQNCKDAFSQSVIDKFQDLREKAEHCNNVAQLKSIESEVDAVKIRFINEIAAYAARMQAAADASAQEEAAETPVQREPIQPVKRRKTVSIKSVSNSLSWQIENQADIERYTAALRAKLQSMLEEGLIINIEF